MGLPPENEGSCFYFFKTKLFEPLQLPPSQYHLLNAMAEDLDAECKKMDALIDDKGGIDAVSYTHLRAHETVIDLVCRIMLEKKKKHIKILY